MNGEMFVANEYVGACWKVNCNVETGIGFIDTNNNKKYEEGIDKKICQSNPRSGCDDYHGGVPGISDDGPVANAMWQPVTFDPFTWKYVNDGDPYDVYWWSTGNTDHDQHFTKVSDAEWETNPNAS